MSNTFEIGEAVVVDTRNYLQHTEGIVIDASSSVDGCSEDMYTVEVENHGTHFFYGSDLRAAAPDEPEEEPEWRIAL